MRHHLAICEEKTPDGCLSFTERKMKTSLSIVLPLSLFTAINLFAQGKPLTATQVVDEAVAQAARQNNNVIIIFHASWCGWCRKMDSSMADPGCKAFFDEHFVIYCRE